ncbi:hypothetical protein N7471_009481 [Penicillium samsonianum]|uniref:uncharacterized protein n=1 Tax=Penicillium samsonianum TaxID=1882272 RepID=UPI002547E7B3|nr:uncharacterized protein N7471_009481 [Penicillium samsonianum]KAJ6128264.1 hypothetical protein N7471_009481 [Penicillium samsonianum]
MSNLLRRASDALHHRQRQDSSDSTDAPKSPDAAKPPKEEPLNQKSQSAPTDSHDKDTFAGTATDDAAQPKQRRHWDWVPHRGNKPETKEQPSQEQRDNTN